MEMMDDKTPHHYVTEPPRGWKYSPLPPDVTFKEEGITLKHHNFVVSTATMIVTSLVLFFIPLFNGLLGGTFGGFHARRLPRALLAAAVSSVAVPGVLRFLYLFDTPDFLRMFGGLGFNGWAMLHVIGTFIGAVAGVASRPLALTGRLRRAHVGPGDTRTVPVTTPVSRSVTRERVEARANPTTTTTVRR
jgi:hypothetical protein